MSGVTLVWAVSLGAAVTLGLMQLLIWFKMNRDGWAHLAFAFAALGVAGTAVGELLCMSAPDVATFAVVQRWMHVALLVVVAGMVSFVRLYFGTGRRWLGVLTVVLRGLSLMANFVAPLNLNYVHIDSLAPLPFLGQTVQVVSGGVPNPWNWLAVASSGALVVYVADAARQLWRKGAADDRRRCLVIAVPIVGFVVAATIHSMLVHHRFIQAPYLISFFFLGIIVAMAHELSRDVVRAGQLADEVRDSREQMALAVAAAHLGLWAWRIREDRIWVNPEGRALYGLPEEGELALEQFLNRVAPEDRADVDKAIRDALQPPGSLQTEYQIQMADQRHRIISVRGRVEFDPSGHPVLMRGVSIDITEHRQAEAMAAQRLNELAHLSRVHSLGQLSGALAHELNQPLGIILSNAQAAQRLLAAHVLEEGELKSILEDIVEEDRRAGDVIQRMRSMLKRGQARLTVVSVNEAVLEVLRLARSDLLGRGVRVRTDLAVDLPPVEADPVQLQQVILNLILNGCDAMAALAPRERRLNLRTTLRDGTVHLQVEDFGCGLPDGEVEKVFQPFFTTKPHGLGMGLAICRSIVEMHGGRLWAETGKAAGALFHLELPPASSRLRAVGGAGASDFAGLDPASGQDTVND